MDRLRQATLSFSGGGALVNDLSAAQVHAPVPSPRAPAPAPPPPPAARTSGSRFVVDQAEGGGSGDDDDEEEGDDGDDGASLADFIVDSDVEGEADERPSRRPRKRHRKRRREEDPSSGEEDGDDEGGEAPSSQGFRHTANGSAFARINDDASAGGGASVGSVGSGDGGDGDGDDGDLELGFEGEEEEGGAGHGGEDHAMDEDAEEAPPEEASVDVVLGEAGLEEVLLAIDCFTSQWERAADSLQDSVADLNACAGIARNALFNRGKPLPDDLPSLTREQISEGMNAFMGGLLRIAKFVENLGTQQRITPESAETLFNKLSQARATALACQHLLMWPLQAREAMVSNAGMSHPEVAFGPVLPALGGPEKTEDVRNSTPVHLRRQCRACRRACRRACCYAVAARVRAARPKLTPVWLTSVCRCPALQLETYRRAPTQPRARCTTTSWTRS